MKKNQEYDALASQIGDLGGETPINETNNTSEPATLGKLQHKSSYGAKDDLTEKEKEEMEAFMQRQRAASQARTFRDTVDEETPITDGWVLLDRAELGIRSQFYPESWDFYIRPATVQAIKNWLSVDEENLYQLNKVFNEIIKFCVKIVDNEANTNITWSSINAWDKFWFAIKVREITFANQKAVYSYEDTCSECDQDIKFELRSKNLYYEFPDEDLVEKYWNGSEWIIDPREYDVDHDVVTLYTPTLAKEIAIIEWARREHERGKNPDEIFIKYAVWLINKPSRDAAMFDKQMKKVYADYKYWDVEFFKFMDQVITNITVNPKETLKQKCPYCGEEVVSSVQFPNGIKVLFDVETKGKKFGSR